MVETEKRLIDTLVRALKQLHEIVVVDDGSRHGTVAH